VRAGGLTVRTLFTFTLVVIVVGLVYFSLLGFLHQ
jgi:hypothetical protein